jgi:MFS family permease
MLAATFGAFVNYAVLLTVVPMWAVSGGAGAAGAGGTTGAFMLVTVLTQLGVPWMLRRVGYRWVLVAGILALGVPAIGYAVSSALPVLMAVSVVRGVGFGMVTVAGAGLVPHLLPRWAHGRGAGLYGLAIGTPNLLALPLGVWAAGHIGYRPIFVVLTALPVAGALVAVAMKTNRTADAPTPRAASELGARTSQAPADGEPDARTRVDGDPGARTERARAEGQPGTGTGRARADGQPDTRTRRAATLRPLVAPWLMLWTSAIIAGGLLTFLPIAVAHTAAGIVPVALLAFSAGAMGSRWGAGVLNDRRGMGRSLPVAIVSGVVGASGLVAATLTGGGAVTAAVTVAGALAVGLGFGAVQNDTLVIMFASGSGYGLASAVWNTAFDAGTGAAAVGVGLIVQHLGYPVGFGVSGVVALACLPLALRRFSRRIPDQV